MTGLREFDERPWLVLCEGDSDKRFLHKLINVRGIPNEFQIRFPSRGENDGGGRSKFGPWLDAAIAVTGWEHIKGVLLLSDKDEGAEAALDEIQRSLARGDGLPNPIAERTVAKASGFPPLTVLLVPHSNERGSLETLCLNAAYSKWPHVEEPLDTFANEMGVDEWLANKAAKMRLQTVIAATCVSRPDAGFKGHWDQAEQYHLPVDNAAFDDLADFLSGFRALVEGS